MGADYFKEKPKRRKGETQEPEYRAPPSEAGTPNRPKSARTPAAVRPAEVPLECNNVTVLCVPLSLLSGADLQEQIHTASSCSPTCITLTMHNIDNA
jgi:hypothetical protein